MGPAGSRGRTAADLWQECGDFLRQQAERAGMGSRDVEQAFRAAAQREQTVQREVDPIGGPPTHRVSDTAFSKSHIDRIFNAQARPKPPLSFTMQFLRITSQAAGLTLQEHQSRASARRSTPSRSATTRPPRTL